MLSHLKIGGGEEGEEGEGDIRIHKAIKSNHHKNKQTKMQ